MSIDWKKCFTLSGDRKSHGRFEPDLLATLVLKFIYILFIYINNLCKLSSWTIMERATRRVNSAYYDEVYDAFWAQKNFVQEDIKKTMDARPGNSNSKVQKKTNF